MRISTKGRYGLAVMVKLAEHHDTVIPISTLSDELGLSKIYLEQVLHLLKSGGLVHATKGPQGGYRLASDRLTIKEILAVLEPQLFEKVETCCEDKVINQILASSIFLEAQTRLDDFLQQLTLSSLVSDVVDRRQETPMFYI